MMGVIGLTIFAYMGYGLFGLNQFCDDQRPDNDLTTVYAYAVFDYRVCSYETKSYLPYDSCTIEFKNTVNHGYQTTIDFCSSRFRGN